jgi:hypothetical protein
MTNPATTRCCCSALVTAAFLFLLAPATHAQTSGAVWGDSFATPPHNPTAAPTAMETLCAVPDHANGGIQLYAMTANGIEMQDFDGSIWNWRSWQDFGNQSGWPVVAPYYGSHWDPMLTGLSWLDRTSFAPSVAPRVNLFHEFTVIGYNDGLPAIWLGEPWRVQPPNQAMNYHYGYDFTPMGGFYPKTTFGQAGGQINVWGTDKAAHHPYLPTSQMDRNIYGPTAQNLIERYWNGSNWSYMQHSNPNASALGEILVGPCSSAWTGTGRIAGVVAVIENDGNGAKPYVHEWDTNHSGWIWQGIGSPSGANFFRAPLLVAYQKGGNWYIRCFVVGLFNGSNDPSARPAEWHLFSIEMHPDRSWYDDQGNLARWNDHGPAPNVSSNQFDVDVNGNPFGFDMTARAIWNEGSTTRVNLFGHTDAGDQITEFYFNGSTWQWGGTPHPSPRPNTLLNLYCDTACVANRGGTNQRISVFAHLSDGEIWELRYDLRLGGGWVWEQRQ